jgi:peptidoglycan hydrolase CwlO-like protein
MAETITIDKKPFVVDLKLIWIAAAALVYGVYLGSIRLNTIETDIATLKQAPAKVQLLDDRQRSTEASVKSLSEQLDTMSKESRDVKTKVDKIEGDVAFVRQQISLLTARERGR